MSDPTQLFRGQGILSLAERTLQGLPMGFLDMGNCTELAISPRVERIEHMEQRTGRQFKDKVIERMVDATLSFTLESIAAENLKRYFYGSKSDIAGATITNEIVIGYRGRKAKLSRINVNTFTSLTNAGATVTYTEGQERTFAVVFDDATDTFTAGAHGLSNGDRVHVGGGTVPTGFTAGTNYFVIGATATTFQLSATFGGSAVNGSTAGSGVTVTLKPDYRIDERSGVLTFSPTANFSDGDSLRANYVSGESAKVAGFTKPNKEVWLLFEGLNTAEDDAPVAVQCYKVRLDPASEWQLISDTFSQFQIAGTLLYDTLQPDDDINGRFFRVEKLAE